MGKPLEIDAIRRAVLAAIEAIAPETDVQRLQPDQPLRRQIELDSMDWINVIAGLHERLAVDFPESDLGRMATINSIVDYVASRRAGHATLSAPAKEPAPAALPCTLHLVNGTPVMVRPIRPDDVPLEADFVRHLSTEARYQRFMVTVRELPEKKLHYFTDVDQVRHVALVAAVERCGQQAIVGVVRYIVDPGGSACEFAIAVDDAWQGSGLAGILMHALIDVAHSRGLATMQGFVLASNTRMLKFTRQLGFSQQRHPEDRDTVCVARPL